MSAIASPLPRPGKSPVEREGDALSVQTDSTSDMFDLLAGMAGGAAGDADADSDDGVAEVAEGPESGAVVGDGVVGDDIADVGGSCLTGSGNIEAVEVTRADTLEQKPEKPGVPADLSRPFGLVPFGHKVDAKSTNYANPRGAAGAKKAARFKQVRGQNQRAPRMGSRIPLELLNDVELNKEIARCFPNDYDFEIHKVIWAIQKARTPVHHVGLQMPDGLVQWAPNIASILETWCSGVTCTILGDTNFGACCIDDIVGDVLGVDFLVHFGHSCLIPTDQAAART